MFRQSVFHTSFSPQFDLHLDLWVAPVYCLHYLDVKEPTLSLDLLNPSFFPGPPFRQANLIWIQLFLSPILRQLFTLFFCEWYAALFRLAHIIDLLLLSSPSSAWCLFWHTAALVAMHILELGLNEVTIILYTDEPMSFFLCPRGCIFLLSDLFGYSYTPPMVLSALVLA